MTEVATQRTLRTACVLSLAGTALMVWSVFDPRPLPSVGAMTLGQALGTLSLALYIRVVVADLRRAKVLR